MKELIKFRGILKGIWLKRFISIIRVYVLLDTLQGFEFSPFSQTFFASVKWHEFESDPPPFLPCCELIWDVYIFEIRNNINAGH